MSRLSDLVNEAVILNTQTDGKLMAGDAVASIKPALDDDHRDTLITEALTVRVTSAAKNSKSSILRMARKGNLELPFHGLLGSYPVDIDGRYMKRTESLTREEMQRVINIRDKQILDDQKHLAELRAAFMAVKPVWDSHPGWTFGQCCKALLKDVAA